MPTPYQKNLSEAYPAIKAAVTCVEVLFDGRNKSGEQVEVSVFDLLRREGASPPETARTIKSVLRSVYNERFLNKRLVADVDSIVDLAIKEMDHPQFLAYIRGKLGAV